MKPSVFLLGRVETAADMLGVQGIGLGQAEFQVARGHPITNVSQAVGRCGVGWQE